MSRSTKAFLIAAMAAALILTAFLLRGLERDRREIGILTARLEESRNSWETTAAEKEALQADLTTVRNGIREAQLTLEESTARAEQLRSDIEELEAEIAALEEKAEQKGPATDPSDQ